MANWAQKMKLHHLQMLVALGEQGNLTHVARMMNISQPALSKWLSQLEDEIGITLFERHSKGLRPSEGGNCCFSMRSAWSTISSVRSLKSPALSKAGWWEA